MKYTILLFMMVALFFLSRTLPMPWTTFSALKPEDIAKAEKSVWENKMVFVEAKCRSRRKTRKLRL